MVGPTASANGNLFDVPRGGVREIHMGYVKTLVCLIDWNRCRVWHDLYTALHTPSNVFGQKDLWAATEDSYPVGQTDADNDRDHRWHSGD